MKTLLFGHRIKADDTPYIEVLLETLQAAGCDVSLHQNIASQLSEEFNLEKIVELPIVKQLDTTNLPDYCITLGGDGTILRAIMTIKDFGIPILGINLGRLGFLASTEKTLIKEALQKLKTGQYQVKTRRLIQLYSDREIFQDFPFALNDMTIGKRDTSSMVTVHTYANEELLNSYWADGIILATPTGSTGYSLSCGGPIIFPNSGNFVITPIAPHNLNVRPIVLPDDVTIKFRIEGRANNYLCTMDSRYEMITSEDELVIKKAPFEIKLVQLDGNTFLKTIQEKLTWGEDKRN